MNPGHPLYTAAQVRELDRLAIEAGTPGYTLMERAGRAAWSLIHASYPQARSIQVLCGTGNNGGDGYIVAKLAMQAERQVRVIQVGAADGMSADASKACDAYRAAGGEITAFNNGDVALDAELLVDALLGTGLDRPLAGDWKRAVEQINAAGVPVVAIDIPTGLNADTGAVHGTAVYASHTLTFVGRKRGLYTGRGPDCCGTVSVESLAVHEPPLHAIEPAALLYSTCFPEVFTVRRRRAAHKSEFGHLLVAGGDSGMAGAVRLAGEAALRSGAGLVSVATRAAHVNAIVGSCPELMVHAVEDASAFRQLAARADAVVIGPGLGQSAWSQALLSVALELQLPMVMDADALNLLSRQQHVSDNRIITPHPGEAARLLASDAASIQADRFAAVASLQARCGGVAVLKGAGTLVQKRDAPPALVSSGNPGMATAGTGDVLAGIAGAFLAQGFALDEAALLAVAVHGCAGDRAAIDGERGMLARDVIAAIRGVINPADGV